MINLLIYGTGNTYAQLKKILNWKQIKVKAFLETEVKNECFEGCSVYTPEKYIIGEQTYDYILCASIYELEMRKNLKQLQIPEEKIISGKMDLDNFSNYPNIFDIDKIIVYQNQKILKTMQANLKETQKIISRNRFYDLIIGIDWMQNLSITAGEWTVGYYYMYVMLRTLLTKKPNRILELGLGQSSKILARYHSYMNCHYDIVEQDESWYQFFASEFDLSNEINVYIRPIEQVYNKKYRININSYTNFNTVILDKKYEFISIDGPWGSEGISRIDILSHIPQCLEKNFCIMLDDYERDGEKI